MNLFKKVIMLGIVFYAGRPLFAQIIDLDFAGNLIMVNFNASQNQYSIENVHLKDLAGKIRGSSEADEDCATLAKIKPNFTLGDTIIVLNAMPVELEISDSNRAEFENHLRKSLALPTSYQFKNSKFNLKTTAELSGYHLVLKTKAGALLEQITAANGKKLSDIYVSDLALQNFIKNKEGEFIIKSNPYIYCDLKSGNAELYINREYTVSRIELAELSLTHAELSEVTTQAVQTQNNKKLLSSYEAKTILGARALEKSLQERGLSTQIDTFDFERLVVKLFNQSELNATKMTETEIKKFRDRSEIFKKTKTQELIPFILKQE